MPVDFLFFGREITDIPQLFKKWISAKIFSVGNGKLSGRYEVGERRDKVNTADAYASHRFTSVGPVGLV